VQFVPLKYPVCRTSADKTFLRDFPYGALELAVTFAVTATLLATSSASRASCPRFILRTSILIGAGEKVTYQVMKIVVARDDAGDTRLLSRVDSCLMHEGEPFLLFHAVCTLPLFVRSLTTR
jgi:hypothetical protein